MEESYDSSIKDISESFLLNENPFILSSQEFGSKELKNKLEAVQSLQPPFIPFAIDQSELKSALQRYYENHDRLVEELTRRHTAKKAMQGAGCVPPMKDGECDEEVDLLIKTKQIRLYNKQMLLRERVYIGLKEIMTPEQLGHAHMCTIPEEEKDASLVDWLEKRAYQKNGA